MQLGNPEQDRGAGFFQPWFDGRHVALADLVFPTWLVTYVAGCCLNRTIHPLPSCRTFIEPQMAAGATA
jgi:hypothetical protein